MFDFSKGQFFWVHPKGKKLDIVYVLDDKYVADEVTYQVKKVLYSNLWEEPMLPGDFKSTLRPVPIDPKSEMGKLTIETFIYEFCKAAGVRK